MKFNIFFLMFTISFRMWPAEYKDIIDYLVVDTSHALEELSTSDDKNEQERVQRELQKNIQIVEARVKGFLIDAPANRDLSTEKQRIILDYIDSCGQQPQKALDDLLQICLDGGPKCVGSSCFAAVLIGAGANVFEVMDTSGKKAEYMATMARAAKKHLLCNEKTMLTTLLQTKLFPVWLLNDWLLLAADAGKYESLELLVGAGAQACATDADGNTIFHVLAQAPYKKEIPDTILHSNIATLSVLSKRNRQGKIFVDFSDSKSSTGQKMIQAFWSCLVQEGTLSVGDRKPSAQRKKKLMLDFFKH